VHKKKSTGEIFYVGKGSGYRAYCPSIRNKYWDSVRSKYGYDVHIEKAGMTEDDAYHEERVLIKNLLNSGVKLTNLTDGGIGGKSKKVYCSNGEMFDSVSIAALAMVGSIGSIDSIDSARSNISSCARGKSLSFMGKAWCFNGVPDAPDGRLIANRKAYGVSIYKEGGSVFLSFTDAIDHLRSQGFDCSVTGLRGAIRDGRRYLGKRWSLSPEFDEEGNVKSKSDQWRDNLGRRVAGSSGVCFLSVADAADYVAENGNPVNARANISRAARDVGRCAYGQTWSYDCSKTPEFVSPSKKMSEAKRKSVRNEKGDVFSSLTGAAKEMKSMGVLGCSRSNILRSIKSNNKKKAGDMMWEYI